MVRSTWKNTCLLIFILAEVKCQLRYNRLNPQNLPEIRIRKGEPTVEMACNTWAKVDPGATVRIRSENSVENGKPSVYCLRTFYSATIDSRMQFSCTKFSLGKEESRICKPSSSHLKIWERNQQSSEIYCGNDMPRSFVTSGTMLNLGFYSNWRDFSRGFDCYVSVFSTNDTAESLSPSLPLSPLPHREDLSSTTFFPSSCKCGIPNSPFLNSNASEFAVGIHEFPWLAIIRTLPSVSEFCSGALISSKFVLTSATCVAGKTEKQIEVVLGEHNLLNGTETNQTLRMRVEDIMVHPEFNRSGLQNDIALVKMSKSVEHLVTSSTGIRTACLFHSLRKETRTNVATIVGWQNYPWGPEVHISPEKLTVAVLPQAACNTTLLDFNVTQGMLCVIHLNQGTCRCDVGGPLTIVDNGRHYLAGIGSVVQDCTNGKIPAVYTKVTEYMEWIEQNTGNSHRCSP